MITDILLYIFYVFIAGFLNLFSTLTIVPDWLNSLSDLSNTLNKVNKIIPVDILFFCISFLITFELTIFTFKSINWIINKVRGSG